MINAQYNVSSPNSVAVKVAAHQRRKMYAEFLRITCISPEDLVLDVGVTSDESYSHSNYFEAYYPYKHRITSVGLDDASFLTKLYPGLTFIEADGRDLPFSDNAFDYVHSSAVIEHVGSAEMQALFLRELWRVARKGVFVTTPNRWFPIEFHTVLPMLHWLPPALFRRVLRGFGKEFFAAEENLNLLSARGLKKLAIAAGMRSCSITSVSLLGWPTNLLLAAQKSGNS